MTSFKFSGVRSLGIISGLCLAMLTPSIASALLIDNFSNAELVVRSAASGVGTTTNMIQTNLTGVVNTGDRQAQVSIINPLGTPLISRESSLDIGGGVLGFSNDTAVRGTFDLFYTDIGTIDASAIGQVLAFEVDDNDLAGGVFTLTLKDAQGDFDTTTVALPGTYLGALSIAINTTTFDNVFLNLAGITSINFSYAAAAQSGDLALVNGLDLTTVPEPSSLAIALTGLGLAGVYFRRRRNQLSA